MDINDYNSLDIVGVVNEFHSHKYHREMEINQALQMSRTSQSVEWEAILNSMSFMLEVQKSKILELEKKVERLENPDFNID